jgi:hypothetical protein
MHFPYRTMDLLFYVASEREREMRLMHSLEEETICKGFREELSLFMPLSMHI